MRDILEGRDPELHKLCIDAVRVLAMDAVERAQSGHPGTPMALAPMGYLLWSRHLRHDPANPGWPDRDRFVLSLGHASMLIYSLLHLTGYDLPLHELRNFRQWGSKTPGHPENFVTTGVETTTGPLGQGVANSVGMALAERWLAARFNRPGHEIVDHRTWAFCSDGDLMEGISHEVAELAGHQRLGKLIWVFDDNRITIEGSTELASSTDQESRFRGYGWHVLRVDDGEDLEALDGAFRAAKEETGRPTLVIVRTTIAEGSPNKAGHHSTHGSPLGEDEIRAAKENLGYPSLEPFHVPERAREAWSEVADRGREMEAEWRERWAAYSEAHPDEARELEAFLAGDLPGGWPDAIPDLSGADAQATRASSGEVIQGLASAIPNLVGGSADLGSSNKTDIEDADSLLPDTPAGRVLHFGVREHGMGGILNGMALHGGLRVFGGTFLIFSDYMRGAIRLAALMGAPVTYVFTHDSIGLGEDGPTHQPVEHLMALRAIPELMDLRPGDPAETAVAWRMAIERDDGPSFLSLTRQKVPSLDRKGGGLAAADGVRRGGYVLAEAGSGAPDLLLLASGSELHLAVEARERLEAEGIATRVVSLPSWYLFSRQDETYRNEVLPPGVGARVSIEAGVTLGWERWIGSRGTAIGLDRFGASAPGAVVFEKLGFRVERIVQSAKAALEGAEEGSGAPA